MRQLAWVMAIGVIGVVGCECDSRRPGIPDVNVVSFAPDGMTYDELAAMEVTFDEPIVAEAAVGEPVTERYFEVEPEVEVAVHWSDRQTLVVKPSEPLTPGTRYSLTLDQDTFPANVPEDQLAYTFVFHPLEVTGIAGVDSAWFPPQDTFELRFNLPVRAGDVAEHCRFSAGESTVAVAAVDADETGPTVAVRPASALDKGTAYELSCEGLAPAEGNEPLAAAYTTNVNVYPDAGVASVAPAGSGPVTPDELEVVVTTQTPVDIEQIRRHVRIRPAVAGFGGRWMSRGDTSFYQVVNLDASTDYTLTVRGGLTDRFGQTLSGRHRTQFTTTDASPRLHMETGIYAVEAESAGYPVWSRNVSSFGVQCAFIPKTKIPEVLTTTMDYDPWYSDGSHGMNWDQHGLAPVQFDVTVPRALNRWHLNDIDLASRCGGGAGRRGMYLAQFTSEEVENDRSGDRYWQYPYRLLGNVTNLGVLLKAGPSSGLVWVTQISDGEPVAGATVTVYDPRGRRVHSGRTDASGIARMPGSTRLLRQRGPGDREEFEDGGYYEYDSFRAQRMIVVVEKAGDVAAVDGNWQNGIQIWNFGVPQDTRTGGETVVRGLILSDRGIYRPGETVHFKGFVRELAPGRSPAVPRTRNAVVHLEDSRGSELTRRRIELTEFGGFSFDYRLSREASLGDYYVRATVGRQTFRERFSVEEFRPATFEITEPEGSAEARIGERVQRTYTASYLFGAPVAGAEAEWTVYRRRRFLRFSEYPGYTWDDNSDSDYGWFWYGSGESSQSYVTDGRARTDRAGNIRVSFQDRARDLKGPQDYLVNVRVTDPTDQTISKRSVVTVHPTDLYLGLHTQEYVQAAGMPFAVNAVAVNPDGERVATRAKLSYLRRNQTCTRTEGPYGYRTCETELQEVWSRNIRLAAGGVSTQRFTPEEAGRFIIKLEATDSAGREVAASSGVLILGEGEAFWSGDESARMSLIASKERYDPGDTARLVPEADVGGATALITTERSGVIDARVVRLTGGVSAVEVPITGDHAPNVFVSVAAVRGRGGEGDGRRPLFRMGLANLEVSPSAKTLAVQVTTERQDYRPGDTVNGTVRVLHGGAPVRAEVSLSVADEGVLQLVNYQTPNPMTAFYRSWGLGVENATNWNRIARSRPPLGWEEEDGADSGGGDDSPRSRFVSSAFWAPALVTDSEGNATFSFEAPDNLTAFRLMAAAADVGDRFGSAERRIRIRRSLMATPILPRFFNEGDRARIGVSLHNYTDSAGEATVSLETTGLWVRESDRTQTVEVPANGTARVIFRSAVSRHRRNARVVFTAEMGSHRDGFEKTLEIRKPRIVDHEILTAGRMDAAGNAEAEVAWADPTLPPDSHLEVTVDRTGLAELEPSLRHLIDYPYGCLEQTLSRLIPMFQVRDLATSLRLPQIRNQRRLRTFINLGVAKVIRHQHANGHFSLWPSTETDPHYTAYAMWGLSLARQAGVRVRRDPVRKGLDALKRWANGSGRSLSGGEGATAAMAAYVLASWDEADAGLNARLYEARGGLPHYGKALLLRALVKAGATREHIDTLAGELVSAASVEGARAIVSESEALTWWWSTDVRSTAITLSALIDVDADHELIPKLVEGLKHRRTRGRWGSTQENLYALVGLADYARSRAEGNVRVTVKLGERTLETQTLRGGSVLHLSRRLSRLSAGTLRIEADGPVYYNARLALARLPTDADATSEGFTIAREYLDFESDTPITDVRVGQLIKVRLKVASTTDLEHVALSDPIPAGCEIVNVRLATESADRRGGGSGSGSGSRGWRWWRWSHTDLRDDRAEAFATRFGGGEHVLEYVMRATRAGTFAAPAARVEAMYQPELMARTNSTSLRIRPRR